eukprot:PhF_6_TR28202/c0_g1_i2/m.41745
MVNAIAWTSSSATGTAIVFDNNLVSGQAAFDMTTPSILVGSTFWLKRNIFTATAAVQMTFRVRVQGGKLRHEESNRHIVGTVAVYHTGTSSGNNTFAIDLSSFASYIYTGSSANDYLTITRSTVPNVALTLNTAVGTSFIIADTVISTSATLSVQTAADSSIGLLSSTIAAATLTGTLSSNSSMWLRSCITTGTVVLSPTSTCPALLPCVIEVKNSVMSAASYPLQVNGPIGDGSYLHIANNSITCTGDVTPLYFATTYCLRSGAGLGIFGNTITSR